MEDESEVFNWAGFGRSEVLAWIALMKETEGDVAPVPPAYIILYPDLLVEGWGWTRLVPYKPGYVEWPEFKKYLEEYFSHNSTAEKKPDLGAEKKPETLGCIAAEKSVLEDAANLCLKKETMLLKNCVDFLTPGDLGLIRQIKQHVKQMIQSEVDRPLAAALCLECIAMEAELMLYYLPCDFDTNEEVALCRNIRLSAYNLIRYKGYESAAVAGAMVGIIREAKSIDNLLNNEDDDICMEFLISEKIRACTAKVLTQFEKDFACRTAAANITTRPIGALTDMTSDVSGSMEACADMDKDCGNNQGEGEVNHESEASVAILMTTKK